MHRKKIAFCIPDMIVGGVETIFISTLTELSQHTDLKITVFMQSKLNEHFYQDWFNAHPQISIKTLYPLLHYFEVLKKHTNFFPIKPIRKLIFSIYKKYRRLIFNLEHHDIFIDYKNASFFKELRHIHKPKITWCHGSFDFFQQNKLIKRLKYYNKMVVLTDEFQHEFNSYYPHLSNKIIRIYNSIDPAHITSMANCAPTYNGKYFCSVSRLGAPKDITTIIHAFVCFLEAEQYPDVKLLIIGDGPYRHNLELLAKHSNAQNHIAFLGTQTNPFGYMKNSMAHILSSNNEGFGMVLLEATAVGTLNISTNHKNGAREILLNGAGGILFDIGDYTALAKIMCDIYHNNIPRQEIIKKCQLSLDRFAPKTITKQILHMINSI